MPATTRKSAADKAAADKQKAQAEDEELDKFLEEYEEQNDEEERIKDMMEKIRSKYRKNQSPSEETLRDMAMKFLKISEKNGNTPSKDTSPTEKTNSNSEPQKTNKKNGPRARSVVNEDESSASNSDDDPDDKREEKKRRVEKAARGASDYARKALSHEFQHTVFPQGGAQTTDTVSTIKIEQQFCQHNNKNCRNLHAIRTKCSRVIELAQGSHGAVSTIACAKEPEWMSKYEVEMLTEYTTEMIVATVLLKYPYADVEQVENDANTMLQKNLTSNALKILKNLSSHSVIMKTWDEVAENPKRQANAHEQKAHKGGKNGKSHFRKPGKQQAGKENADQSNKSERNGKPPDKPIPRG